jgi:hypothetical protein
MKSIVIHVGRCTSCSSTDLFSVNCWTYLCMLCLETIYCPLSGGSREEAGMYPPKAIKTIFVASIHVWKTDPACVTSGTKKLYSFQTTSRQEQVKKGCQIIYYGMLIPSPKMSGSATVPTLFYLKARTFLKHSSSWNRLKYLGSTHVAVIYSLTRIRTRTKIMTF